MATRTPIKKPIKKIKKVGPPKELNVHGVTIVLTDLIKSANDLWKIRSGGAQRNEEKAILMWMRQKLDQLALFRCAYYKFSHHIVDDETYDIRENELAMMAKNYPELYQKALKQRPDSYNPTGKRIDPINKLGSTSSYPDNIDKLAEFYTDNNITDNTRPHKFKRIYQPAEPVKKKIVRRVIS